ncbi:MAG TPA: sigma-54 dependent transcriptional regulator [Spirochaetia bacterium]|nr:sigma-54 dependent transcriptional regulator [Spirochaetia bacterium]
MVRILMLDPDERSRKTFAQILSPFHHILAPETFVGCADLVQQQKPDIVFLEVDLPGTNGIDMIPELLAIPHPPQIIMYSTISAISTVVAAIRAGAVDYVAKPALLSTIQASIREAVARRLVESSMSEGVDADATEQIIGRTAVMRELKNQLVRFAPAADPVLLIGESGTGKELAARTIHRLSPRGRGPFVPVNCAAVPDTLFEAEMFGVDRGGYTDAIARGGFFERANGGTLFLDEIGELAAASQSKLLRILEDNQVCRIGSTRPRNVDVRVLFATNTDLKAAVAERRFRRDLYYRINILTVVMPPLRARLEDIPNLVAAFLRDTPHVRVSDPAIRCLLRHDWPGNVRELHGTIRRASIFAEEGTIEPHHLQFP